MTRTDHLTADQYEALIVRYGRTVAARTLKDAGPEKLGRMMACDVYDACRDFAYDLLDQRGGAELVDEMLCEVTDEASARILETVEDLRHNA